MSTAKIHFLWSKLKNPIFFWVKKATLSGAKNIMNIISCSVDGRGFRKSPHISVPTRPKDKLGFDQVIYL